MLLLICTTRQHVSLYLRRPRRIAAGCPWGRAQRCASAIEVLPGLAIDELEARALRWGLERGNTDKLQEQLRNRVQAARVEFDRRTKLRAMIDALYPNSIWWYRRAKLRQLLEQERHTAARERRQEREWEIEKPRAERELDRVRDRLERRPHTTGVRRAAHWAPDWVFPNRRVNGVMPRDRAPDSAPPIGRTRKRLKQLERGTRAERRDPTCGGFFKPPELERRSNPPANVRRAQLRVDVARDMDVELEKVRRAGIRRRPGGQAA